jgi:hypothetical protein
VARSESQLWSPHCSRIGVVGGVVASLHVQLMAMKRTDKSFIQGVGGRLHGWALSCFDLGLTTFRHVFPACSWMASAPQKGGSLAFRTDLRLRLNM